ncbi:tape measure protein [Pseudomonas iridis]|uniref:tape measure protein n=1 Tax=Pseudomonas iridis TaxID=2710587 RepID=UPI001B32C665|nr:tape measure protein [Pseudomonas iridis]MBP5966757.1 tape measure protein [Pseudomonas iridis]
MADADVQGMLIRIEATTAQLRQEIARGEAAVAQSAGKMDTSLGRIDSAFDRAGASAQSAGGLIKGALAAAIGAASIGTIIKTADSYSQMSDRIGLATKSFGEYNTVQERLLATANRTYRPLEEAQELYIRTSDSLRSMGLSADQSMDVMDSFSYLLVTNSASADKASSAIDAYSKSLQTGKVEADSWQAILAAMPTIVDTLSKSTNKSAEEIRSLGAQGKLSLDTLTQGLRKSAEANGLLADSMGVAVRDAMVALNNAFTVYIGQLNETTDGTGILASGISVLAENFGTIAEVAGVAAAGTLAAYARGLAASAAGAVLATKAAIDDAMARRAQATAILLAAQADQQKAQTAVFLAEKELAASKTRISGMAVEKQLSLQLAEARMLEARATTAVGAAQGAIVGTGRTLLGLLGGPAGIAMLAIGAATAFLTLRDNTGYLEKKLGDLADPIEKLTKRFNELDRAGKSVTLRGLQENIADTQSKVAQMSGAMADKFENDLRSMGAAGADGLMAGLVSLPGDTQAALDRVRKASKDQASGIVVDWKAVADELRLVPGVTEEMAVSIEESGTSSATAAAQLAKLKDTVSQLAGETNALTQAERENAAAKAEAAGVGQKYLEQLQKQLATSQDKTAVEAANRFISENKLLTKEMAAEILKVAAAKDAQKAADDAATKATKSGTSAAKEAATEAKNQAKALTDLKAQADIAIQSATGLAAAYLAGTDKSREFSLQQKVEEALLKTGAAARAEVEKALKAQQDAQDKLNVSQSAYNLQQETADLIAQAKATLMGADALAAYNAEKALTIALAGKNIEVGSEEYKQMLAATEAQKEALKLVQQAGSAGGIMERLYPEAKLLKDYTADQEALNAAMALYPKNAASYQDALAKLGNEYEVNRSKATIWGQMTEGAIDRIDEAFASAWGNIGSGAESLWDNLKKGFKQTLGEIAHMLTTKPLLASISNWLTGSDNGQGLSSIWGKLLGSATGQGGSAGDANGWGGMVSLGKNLYSAWSNLTGVGSSIASGYASGGVSGALSGGASYYGNMLSNIASTLSSGFTSLIGGNIAITGATAAGTAATTAALTGVTAAQAAAAAATVGAEGITAAALQGAIAEGAASIGTNIGVAGATTAAASQGIAASISGALSSAAAMWPLAVIMGMYQSGKLYDAGVRPSMSEMQATGGDTALGKATMAPIALQSGIMEIQDKINSKLVGGKLAAIISGSTLHQAVWGAVGKKLFGGAWETKDGGISLGVENGEFDPQQYIYQKKKGGLFSSSKKRTRYSDLDAETESALGAAYNDKLLNSMGLFSALGVQLSETVLDGLNVAASKISTKGKTAEAVQEELDKWFAGLGDSAVSAINTATSSGLGGYNFDQLTEFVNNLYTVRDALKNLDVKVLDVSLSSGWMAEQLIAMAGGIEAFNTANNAYYSGFFSDTERMADTLAAVRAQFQAMNVVLPENAAGYRAMVSAIDVTTEAGRQMFVQLTAASESAASAYAILKQRQADYYGAFYSEAENTARTIAESTAEIKRLGVTLPGTRDAFRKMVEDAAKLTTESGKAMYDTLMGVSGAAGAVFDALESTAQAAADAAVAKAQAAADLLNAGVSNSFSAVQRAITAQQKKATEAYNATNTSLSDMSATASKAVTDLSTVSNSLESALKSLRGTSDDAVKMLQSQARATLQSALATARSGGSLSGFTGLEDALNTVSDNNTDLYSSLEDFNRDQGRTANVVAELNAINGKQLTAAEKLQEGLETQIDQAKEAYDAQMAQYDQQLEFAQAQMDALNGVDNSIMGVTAAINAMNAAVVAALQGQATGAGKANTPGNNAALVETLYQSVLGRGAEAAGASYWAAKLQSGAVTYQQAAETIAKEALALDASKYQGAVSQAAIAASKAAAAAYLAGQKVPGYATGGLITGPGTGTSDSMMIRASNGEYMMSAAAVRMFGTGLLDQMNAGRLPAFAMGGAVGETGPHLEITRPSQIYSASSQSSRSGQGGGEAATVAELRGLRREMQTNFEYISKHIKATADHTDEIANRGVPIVGTVDTRVVA